MGGSGAVFKAYHTGLGRLVAVKVLLDSNDNKRNDRIIRESRVLRDLDHPNIVKIYACGITDIGAPYLVMEFLSGETLMQKVQRKVHLEVPEAIDYMRSV